LSYERTAINKVTGFICYRMGRKVNNKHKKTPLCAGSMIL
jgi:hypothetical protein